MPDKKAGFLTVLLSLALFAALLSCASDKEPLKVANSLPQSKIAYYNDSFEKMREDLWDRDGYLYRDKQLQNFKLADMQFESGKLIIRTKTGNFSKGGLGAKYVFRGDFDLQIDCRIDFIKGASGMDHVLSILVTEKNRKIGKADVVFIYLGMKDGSHQGWLDSRGFLNGRWIKGRSEKMENFDGTLRILRKGSIISTFYKKKGESAWNKFHTFQATANDMIFGFQIRNFMANRTSIEANHSITAEFDNFIINAAQAIIEEDI